MNRLISRLTGVFSGLVFTILFLTVPLIDGCESSKATKLISQGLDSGRDDAKIMAAIFIAVLLSVIIGVLLFALDKVVAGSICGMLSMAGLVFLFIDATQELHIGLKDLSAGAHFLFIFSTAMALSYFVGRPFSSGSTAGTKNNFPVANGGDSSFKIKKAGFVISIVGLTYAVFFFLPFIYHFSVIQAKKIQILQLEEQIKPLKTEKGNLQNEALWVPFLSQRSDNPRWVRIIDRAKEINKLLSGDNGLEQQKYEAEVVHNASAGKVEGLKIHAFLSIIILMFGVVIFVIGRKNTTNQSNETKQRPDELLSGSFDDSEGNISVKTKKHSSLSIKERFRFPWSVWFILVLFLYQIVDMVISINIKKSGFLGFANEFVFNDIYDKFPNVNQYSAHEYQAYFHVIAGIIHAFFAFLLSPLEYAIFYKGIGNLQYFFVLSTIFLVFLWTIVLKFKYWNKIVIFLITLSPLSYLVFYLININNFSAFEVDNAYYLIRDHAYYDRASYFIAALILRLLFFGVLSCFLWKYGKEKQAQTKGGD